MLYLNEICHSVKNRKIPILESKSVQSDQLLSLVGAENSVWIGFERGYDAFDMLKMWRSEG